MSKKTQNLLNALRKNYPYPRHALITEFRGGTGWSVLNSADAIAMDTWPSGGLELIGFELKTSRQDWLKELKNPDKSNAIKQFCDKWYVVVDDYYGVLKYGEEVPEDWGVMAMDFPGKVRIKKEAPKLNPIPIDKFFLASLMRLATKEFGEVIIDGRKYIAEKYET